MSIVAPADGTQAGPVPPGTPLAGAAQPVGATRDTLGECVLWCDRAALVYWCDIEGCVIRRCRLDGSALEQAAMPERVGCFALCEDAGTLLVGLASGIASYDWQRRALGPVIAVEPELPGTRINDGRCDRQGRLVFGTYNEARDGQAIGHFYRVGPGLAIERLPLPAVTVANGLAFSPDGTRLFLADSPTRRIDVVAYAADGSLGEPRLFAEVARGDGFPDGATVDAEGQLWSARWDGGCIVRHAPDGRETARVPLPARRVSCPAFGGADRRTLLATTARVGLRDAALAAQPLAGALFALPGAVAGVPEGRYRLAAARA